MANGCYGWPARRSTSSRPTSASTSSTRQRPAVPSSTAAQPRRPATRRSGPRGSASTAFTFTNAGTRWRSRARPPSGSSAPRAARAYPEAGIDISGRPHGGVTSYQEVRGYVDAHTHGMAFEFLGGDAHCGKPWDRFGAPYALVDCPDHTATGGYGGILESVLSGEPHHDPVGWPTFKDWPAPELADPRGHLLPVARAGVARRPADLREPAGREQQALPALPDQAQLLRRHGLDPAAGARTCTRCRTTSTPSSAARARASTGS